MRTTRRRIYAGSAVNWARMMNIIYGPNCKFSTRDFIY